MSYKIRMIWVNHKYSTLYQLATESNNWHMHIVNNIIYKSRAREEIRLIGGRDTALCSPIMPCLLRVLHRVMMWRLRLVWFPPLPCSCIIWWVIWSQSSLFCMTHAVLVYDHVDMPWLYQVDSVLVTKSMH